MSKRVSLLLVVVIVLSLIGVMPKPALAQSSELITITTIGNVEGTNKIQHDGDTYVFTGSISGSIIVERDHIVLDGAGYVLQVSSDWGVGVDIRDRNNVTVKNLTVRGALGRCGILLISVVNCKITQNNIINNLNGIEMTGTSSHNNIANNRIQNNSIGMEIYSVNPGSDNIISGNEVTNNTLGMQIKDFLNTDILGNNVSSNSWGLGLGVGSGSIARNNVIDNNTYGFRAFNIQHERGLDNKVVNVDVDTSNTVNGKPVYYWVDQHDKSVPADAGYVALIGCTGITVKNLILSGNLEGVFLGSTTYSTITNNRLSNNLFGINLDAATSNTINGNKMTGNENGINLRWSSSNNTIHGNEITANTANGIYIADSASNIITENNIANNNKGIYTEYCGTNTLHHNNFVNNTKQWDDIGFIPWPIPLPISTSVWDDDKEGNYWSNYNGTDENGDGIGDTPYILGTNNTDHYPLMKAVAVSEFPDDGTDEQEPFPIALLVTASAVFVTIVCVSLLVYFKKRPTRNLPKQNPSEKESKLHHTTVPNLPLLCGLSCRTPLTLKKWVLGVTLISSSLPIFGM